MVPDLAAWPRGKQLVLYSRRQVAGRALSRDLEGARITVGANYSLITAQGGYIYHKPSDLKDFFWQKWISWDENTKEPNNVGVSLETDRPVKIIAMNATNDFTTGNPSGGGCVAALTYACMLEWVCPVSWYPVAKSPFSMEGCAKGIDAMGGFPDFVENDTHWEKMLGYAAAVADHGAPLFRALINSGADRLGKLSPFLGRVAKSAGNAAITAAQKYNRGQKRGTE